MMDDGWLANTSDSKAPLPVCFAIDGVSIFHREVNGSTIASYREKQLLIEQNTWWGTSYLLACMCFNYYFVAGDIEKMKPKKMMQKTKLITVISYNYEQ